jgi:hypothetical protein
MQVYTHIQTQVLDLSLNTHLHFHKYSSVRLKSKLESKFRRESTLEFNSPVYISLANRNWSMSRIDLITFSHLNYSTGEKIPVQHEKKQQQKKELCKLHKL